MSKQKKLLLIIILLAALLMGIGYAALSNVTLTINGTATATADSENFKVYFTGENTKTSGEEPNSNVEVTVPAQSISATVNFSGLTKKGDNEYAILEIENGSNDVNAESVTVAVEASNEDDETATSVIHADAIMCDATGNAISDYAVASGSKTYVKVSAELLQTPTSDTSINITATITAKAQDATV